MQTHAFVDDRAQLDGPAPEAAPAWEPEPEAGPGVAEVDQLLATGAPPFAIAMALARHPGQLDLMLAHLHQAAGNAMVVEVLTELGALEADAGGEVLAEDAEGSEEPVEEPATDVSVDEVSSEPTTGDVTIDDVTSTVEEPAVEATSEAQVSAEVGTTAEPTPEPEVDVAAAEAFNRGHVRNVVRFDRATHGEFAKRNGELDAKRVARWQADRTLPATGMVDDETCEHAEGKGYRRRHPESALEARVIYPGHDSIVTDGKVIVQVWGPPNTEVDVFVQGTLVDLMDVVDGPPIPVSGLATETTDAKGEVSVLVELAPEPVLEPGKVYRYTFAATGFGAGVLTPPDPGIALWGN